MIMVAFLCQPCVNCDQDLLLPKGAPLVRPCISAVAMRTSRPTDRFRTKERT